MGHRSPNHQWDVHRHSWVLLIPIWARETSISLRVMHEHLRLHRQAREWVEVEVEVEDRAYKLRLQGLKGVSVTPLLIRTQKVLF